GGVEARGADIGATVLAAASTDGAKTARGSPIGRSPRDAGRADRVGRGRREGHGGSHRTLRCSHAVGLASPRFLTIEEDRMRHWMLVAAIVMTGCGGGSTATLKLMD